MKNCMFRRITTTQEVEVEVENGTVDSNKKTVNYNTNIAFTITANEGYTSPTVSCTNEQTATIEEDSLIVNNVVEDTKCTVKYSDVDKPEIEVATTNNMDKKQTATITLKDNIGVKSYYIGPEKPNEQTTYEEIEETKEKKIEKEITTAGTYYVVAKDKSGNISEEKEIIYYQIKFEPTNAEVSVNEVIVSKEITLPTATTTEEYSLGKSWYKDTNCTIKAGEYGTKYTPTTNEILYTKAEKKTYKVTYKTDGNGTISGTTEETVDHGKKATGTTQTANEGYNFINWTADKENIIKNVRNQSLLGVCALVIIAILELAMPTGRSLIADTIHLYCETLVYVSVVMICFVSTGLLFKLKKGKKELNLPKPLLWIIAAVIAFVTAAVLKYLANLIL